MAGRFICIEGGEGTGKTTLCDAVTAYLREQGRTVDTVADPGSTPLSQELRKIVINKAIPCNATQQAMLYLTARSALAEEVKELLAADHDVVCGRWTLSTLVYQGVCQGASMPLIRELTRSLVDLAPHVYIILDAPPAQAIERKRAADPTAFDNDRFDSRGLDWHDQIRDAYRLFAEQQNYALVDASRPLAEVTHDVLRICQDNLPRAESIDTTLCCADNGSS